MEPIDSIRHSPYFIEPIIKFKILLELARLELLLKLEFFRNVQQVYIGCFQHSGSLLDVHSFLLDTPLLRTLPKRRILTHHPFILPQYLINLFYIPTSHIRRKRLLLLSHHPIKPIQYKPLLLQYEIIRAQMLREEILLSRTLRRRLHQHIIIQSIRRLIHHILHL